MTPPLRVALFTDSFAEANGVATLSREFARYAQRRGLPFFCAHTGPKTRIACQQPFTTLELKRGFASFPLDRDLSCDPLLSRYKNRVTGHLRSFQPDLVHIMGPGDFGVMGFWVAHTLGVPLVASWHTNLHQYAGRRTEKLLSFLPDAWRKRIAGAAEHQSLRACMGFYGLARFLLAPNEKSMQLLRERTHKPVFFFPHGVDIDAYSPDRRNRQTSPFCIGYVGRLTPEKNVRFFAELEQRLVASGKCDFRLVMVGEGGEKDWLTRNLKRGELPGILRGDALAAVFANMDVFVFPSLTDTFGLVLLEAMASGVPVIVPPETGVRVGIQHGITGFIAEDANLFTRSVLDLMENETLRRQMSGAARGFASSKVWSGVFDQLYQTYQVGLEKCGRICR